MYRKGKYGHFDIENKEYIITVPTTPTPWINYIGDGNYGGIISNNAGGYSFDKDPRNMRILRYRYNSVPEDQPGRYVYIKDLEKNVIWSATWQPVKSDYDEYQCRHGLGYTIIKLLKDKIETEITYFVPINSNYEIWFLKIKNNDSKPRKLSIFTYAEFSFFDAVKDQQNVDWVQQIQRGTYEENIIFWNQLYMKSDSFVYIGSNEKADSFDTSRDKFIGKYNDLTMPEAVKNGQCSNCTAFRGNGVGALNYKIDLQPNEEKEIPIILGITDDKNKASKIIKNIAKKETIDILFSDLKKYWNNYLDKFQVETPDKDINLFLNVWNSYQCKTTFNWSRFVSLYQLGVDRGMGFRDSAQDTLGVVHSIPELTKELLIKLAKCQFEDGHAYHLFYPLTGEGGIGEAEGGKYNWYSDDHLWLILAVTAYLKETGDINFLSEEFEYAKNGKKETIYNHLLKAIDFTKNHLGKHNIPLAGFADWNDALNLDRGKGVAESVWTGMFFCYSLKLMEELSNFLEKKDDSAKFKKYYNLVEEGINKYAWDGEWYIQAFDDDGIPVGSKTCKEGKIYLNPQSWAIMSGVAGEDKRLKIIIKTKEMLSSKYGFALLGPSYTKFKKEIGGISTYPPGAKENGGIFVHTNPWFILSELIEGLNDEAYDDYLKICPILKNEIQDLHEVEPYVFCQNILSPEHPQFGLGRNSWLTGTAAWGYYVMSQYFIGIRPYYNGIYVEPKVPAKWEYLKVQRTFRGKELDITMKKSKDKKIIINGKVFEGKNFIPDSEIKEDIKNSIEVYF